MVAASAQIRRMDSTIRLVKPSPPTEPMPPPDHDDRVLALLNTIQVANAESNGRVEKAVDTIGGKLDRLDLSLNGFDADLRLMEKDMEILRRDLNGVGQRIEKAELRDDKEHGELMLSVNALAKEVADLDKKEALTSQKVALYIGAAGGLIALGWKVVEALAHLK